MFEIKGKYTTASITVDSLEESCLDQIRSFVNHPAFTNPIVIQPDAHAGKGSCIGFTMQLSDKLIPNIVGVDVRCGILSFKSNPIEISLELLDHKIRQAVPFGMSVNNKPVLDMEKDFPWKTLNGQAEKFARSYSTRFGRSISFPEYGVDWFRQMCSRVGCDLGRAIRSIGSLGGGNHFLELGTSNQGDLWFTVHTGSRNLGKCICEYWQNKAIKKVLKQGKEEARQTVESLKARYTGKELYDQIKASKAPVSPTPEDGRPDALRWLEGAEAEGYLIDMLFAQVYAEENRYRIMKAITDITYKEPLDLIETVHNFIDFKDFIIRKGSIRSYLGERMIIPFNMLDGILICEGKSNPEWNFSAPHGSGRIMSRSQARKNLDVEDFKTKMTGIYSTSVGIGTIDEAPGAYKDSAVIMESISPTAVVLDRIKPVMNMKATDSKED